MILIGHAITASVFLLGGILLVVGGAIGELIFRYGFGALIMFYGVVMVLMGGGILGLGFLWQHLFV